MTLRQSFSHLAFMNVEFIAMPELNSSPTKPHTAAAPNHVDKAFPPHGLSASRTGRCPGPASVGVSTTGRQQRQVLLHESLWVTRGCLLQNHSPSCCLQRCFDLLRFLLGHVSLDLLRKGLHQLLCLREVQSTRFVNPLSLTRLTDLKP